MTGQQRALRILQVNTWETTGGAAGVARQLCQEYRRRGHEAWLAVGRRRGGRDPYVHVIPNDQHRSAWASGLYRMLKAVQGSNQDQPAFFRRLVRMAAEPARWSAVARGTEDFEFPGTRHLLEVPPHRPEIVHGHNLHGGYFDLRALPWLSRQVPVMLTLHDAWLMSGHCAHSFDCERWRTGCGQCPDLTIYPSVWRDDTAANWRRKRNIYARSRLYVATPSRWLMDRVQRSMLMNGAVECRVIPNGVDLSVFKPADKRAARTTLGLPPDDKILVFTADTIRENIWKDYWTLRQAVTLLAQRRADMPIRFLALGGDAGRERVGTATIELMSYEPNPARLALYLQAADIYIHAARAETFPTSILEALACGLPCVATAVGGIKEQIVDGQTGWLTPPGDASAMASAVERLIDDPALHRGVSAAAEVTARRHFDLQTQVEAYLGWYREIIADPQARHPAPAT